MNRFAADGQALLWNARHQTLRIEPWGPDCVRVRCTEAAALDDRPMALVPPPAGAAALAFENEEAVLRNGRLTVRVAATGWTRFLRSETGEVLLEEEPSLTVRHFRSLPGGGDRYRIQVCFRPHEDERFFGLGGHTHGLLDQKGCVIDLQQQNTNVTIPFLVSSRGYGFLWNNPAQGRVELGRSRTRWTSDGARQIDYVVMAGDGYPGILARYADCTGHPPMLPAYAAGFWQSKLRYSSQEEVLEVARSYRERGLPLAVLVIDYYHWPVMGVWDFDPEAFPAPEAMVRELKEMGVETAVSIWPTVNPAAPTWQEMSDRGLIVRTERGQNVQKRSTDTHAEGPVFVQYYDPTHPEARAYIWERARRNYYDRGIRTFWLDSCEPEWFPHFDHDHLRYHEGNGEEVGNLYPLRHEQAFYEGLREAGESTAVTLCRGAWAGSQRYGASIWSGDIPSTFASLRRQLAVGLNMAMSGIPWWNSDIGGFSGGDITDPTFRELVVRWFQFGCFCPLMRLHGVRQPAPAEKPGGADNEVWSFGETAYGILREYLFLRERLRPYILEQMRRAHEEGLPPMRPLFFDHPDDETCYQVADAFLFGPDLLVAPVHEEGARSRPVYLPGDATWHDAWSAAKHEGGAWIEAPAPLERIPVYLRDPALRELFAPAE
jgi:alpha-D-xyloside xylohydrolase